MTSPAEWSRIREKLEAVADLKPAAIADFQDEYEAGHFIEANADEWIKSRRAERPQRFYNVGVDALAVSAFVDGNMTARSKLSKQMTPDELDALARTFGLNSALDFRRGKLSERANGDDDKKKTGGGDRSNPWLADQWNVTRQASLVKSLGVEAAARIAAAAGCKLGSVRPNPTYS